MVAARANQTGVRQCFVHKLAMYRVKGVNINHRLNKGTVVGQSHKLRTILFSRFVSIDQNEFAIGLADQRHLRTNIHEMSDFEIASDVPEILGQLFDGISRAMSDVLFAKDLTEIFVPR